jgi:2-oxoisovalerate dehydrogenase E2 component (dihydrolipoyl transacylase)
VKLGSMRKAIAEHMVRSLATSPHAWTLQEIDVTRLVRYREAEKEGFRARHGVSLTYLPFVVQVVCDAIKQFPWLNSTWSDEGVVLKQYINMGIAVSIPDGLIVPVLKDADQRGFTDLVASINDLVVRARSKQLKPEDVQGVTFTLNNTGATGSVASQPIINQPQAAILTTESIVKRPVVIGDGIAVRDMMNMCLSFDHRIIDGMMAGSSSPRSRRASRNGRPRASSCEHQRAVDAGANPSWIRVRDRGRELQRAQAARARKICTPSARRGARTSSIAGTAAPRPS